jgi:hypothetical protein
MIDMQHRAWITINDFPSAEDEAAWTPFTEALEHAASAYGPVLAWEGTNVGQVVMSADIDDRALFARECFDRVTLALQSAGLADLYPSAIELEPVTDDEPVPA